MTKPKSLQPEFDLEETPITFIHYNDIYEVESKSKEPVGGAARFCTAVKTYGHLDPIVVFSGDAFGPSALSSITKGGQMVPVLNGIGTKVAMFGNHEFDFGLANATDLAGKTNFPWLMSNVIDHETDLPLGGGKLKHIIESNGKKIGFVGLVEVDWLATLATVDPGVLTFRDFVEVGNELASELRKEGCDLVVALTHMRQPNDELLAEKAIGIDLILGGHDHDYFLGTINGVTLVKSGTDFREFSVITAKFTKQGKPSIEVEKIPVTAAYAEDPALKAEIVEYSKVMDSKLGEVLGVFNCDLDGRFNSVRTSETNLGNFISDIMISAMNADCAILNAGAMRSNRIHPAGPFTRKDLLTIHPIIDSLVVLNVTGSQLMSALENGVSAYPKLEGRFPHVAGIRFAFDPKQNVGNRVDPKFVMIGDEYIDLKNKYRLVARSYIASGHDGYTCLSGAEVLTDEESGIDLSTAIQNHFHAIELNSGMSKEGNSRHVQSLITLSRRHSLFRKDNSLPPAANHWRTVKRGVVLASLFRPTLSRQGSIAESLVQNSCKLEPKVEGRIILISSDEVLQNLTKQREKWDLDQMITEEGNVKF